MIRFRPTFVSICCLVLSAVVLSQAAAAANPKHASHHVLIQAADVDAAATDYGLTVLRTLQGADGPLTLAALAAGDTPSSLAKRAIGDGNVVSVEAAMVAEMQGAAFSTYGILAQDDVTDALQRTGTYSTPCLDAHLGTAPWAGWADQGAAALTRIVEAQARAGHCGEGAVVAIIDTGVDADHPMLAGAVLEGFDFLENHYSLSAEWKSIDGSYRAIVEDSLRGKVDGSYRAIVEEGSSQIVELHTMGVLLAQHDAASLADLDLPPYFGHGTMVAGLVRLVAPGAEILPLRVFDGYGEGHSFDIVRAVYYAVDHGADVINMSFSMESPSLELAAALRYARDRGVITVAAVGNQGERSLIYPASYATTLGVVATDDQDGVASFSNVGAQVGDLGAPGVGVLSTFPGGLYAAGWGTSFATPLVAGAAALLAVDSTGDIQFHQAASGDLMTGSQWVDSLSGVAVSGRLDVLGAVVEAGY